MGITQRNYYYRVRGGNDNTLEKVLKLHDIRKANGDHYNENYKHDPEAWDFIKRAASENNEFLNDPMIWKGNPSREKHLNLWKYDDATEDNANADREVKTNIRRWCRSDVNPPSTHPVKYFWCNEMCRFFGASSARNSFGSSFTASSSTNGYHLIIYVGEEIYIPDENTPPIPPLPPEYRVLVYDTNLALNSFPRGRSNTIFRIIWPIFVVKINENPSSISPGVKFRLYTDETFANRQPIYNHSLTAADRRTQNNTEVEFWFRRVPIDGKFTLEVDPGPDINGRPQVKYNAFSGMPFHGNAEGVPDDHYIWDRL